MRQKVPDGALQPNMGQQGNLTGPADVALTFAATEHSVRRALRTVRTSLRHLNLSEMCLGCLEIVLAEATNNIVEHAYQNTGQGAIGLTCRVRDGMLLFEITDTGVSMPKLELPQAKDHDLSCDLEDLPEGGFGWGLIRDMTLSLSYKRYAGRNLLRFSIATEYH
jgi:serine/threonine-protein kinase RsbW